MLPKKLNLLEEFGLEADKVPTLLSQDPSEDECNSFLKLYMSACPPSDILIFIVGPYICGLEFPYEIEYDDPSEMVVRFWILNINYEFQINQLSDDDWFSGQPWMSYYDSSRRIFNNIPLSELHKIIQHLARLSRLSSFF